MKTNTKCNFCNKDIYKRPRDLRKFKKHYCNINCLTDYQKKYNTKNRVEVYCSNCNKKLLRTTRELNKSVNKIYFCDNLCKNRHLIKRRWDKDTKVKCHKSRRFEVINRCKKLCINCGYKDDIKMLDIHHLDGNHQNNEYINLASVCVWCHNLYHRCGIKIENKFNI